MRRYAGAMTSPTKPDDTPQDGADTYWLEKRGAPGAPATAPAETEAPRKQTLEDVLVRGEVPTDAFAEEFREQNDAPLPSDEEIERQALEAGGDDDDPETPE